MMPQKYDLRGKRTFQSDDFEPKFNSTLAVDGCYDTVMDNLCCTHTSDVQPGWWSVDLGEPVIVNSVKVFNRDTNSKFKLVCLFDLLSVISWCISVLLTPRLSGIPL